MLFTSDNSKKEIIQKEIHQLNTNKASQHSEIPNKIVKNNYGTFSDFLYVSTNNSIKSSLFPSCPKQWILRLSIKEGKKGLTDNYRPVGALLVLSKLYEKSISKQLSEYFEKFSQKTNVNSGKVTQHTTMPLSNARKMEKTHR